MVPPLPAEVVDRIMRFVPNNHTLFNLLITSKLFCRLAALHLYRNLIITSSDDILVDTGLLESTLDLRSENDKDEGRKIKDKYRNLSKYNYGGIIREKTVKATFLELIRTITIVPRPLNRYIRRRPNASSCSSSTHPTSRPDRISAKPSSTTMMSSLPSLLRIRCESLTIQLDTSTHDRRSPLPSIVIIEEGNAPIDALLAAIRPRQLIISGAGFHQSIDPTIRLPPPLLLSIRLGTLNLCPDTQLVNGLTNTADVGLAFVTKCIITALQLDRPTSSVYPKASIKPGAVNIRIVVNKEDRETQFPPLLLPRSLAVAGCPSAPEWMQSVTVATAKLLRMARAVTMTQVDVKTMCLVLGARALGTVTFVNFGSFDKAQLGMRNASERDVEEKFEKALRWEVGLRPDGLTVQSSKGWLRFETLDGKVGAAGQ